MSLIADALKTAQREKQRREARDSGPSIAASVLIPLRQPDTGSGARRAILLGSAVVVMSAAAWIAIQRFGPKRPLKTPPPVASRIVSDALSESATPPSTKRPSAVSAPASRRPTRAVSGPPRQAASEAAAVAQAPAAVSTDSIAVPQGQPLQDGAARAALAVPDAQPAGQLRIAVEPARPADARRLFAQAVAAHRAGDLPTARTLYERVLTLTPNDPDALNNLGVLLSAEREFDRALALLRRAATLAPRSAGTWNNIGAALREQGRSSDAIAAYQHALNIDPRHQGARVGLAQQYLAISALDQAKDLLDKVLAANPALAEAHYTLGQVLELQGDRAGAVTAYSAFVSLAPARLAGHVERVRQHLETLK